MRNFPIEYRYHDSSRMGIPFRISINEIIIKYFVSDNLLDDRYGDAPDYYKNFDDHRNEIEKVAREKYLRIQIRTGPINPFIKTAA